MGFLSHTFLLLPFMSTKIVSEMSCNINVTNTAGTHRSLRALGNVTIKEKRCSGQSFVAWCCDPMIASQAISNAMLCAAARGTRRQASMHLAATDRAGITVTQRRKILACILSAPPHALSSPSQD